MSNLAQQLKSELTDRAKNSESCKKHLLDWVMNRFRDGENPVLIFCTNSVSFNEVSKELQNKIDFKYEGRSSYFHFEYRDGKHYASRSGYKNTEVEITDMPEAQRYACDGKDESDKKLFLESEGFKVWKHWMYGKGDIMEIRY